MPPSQSPIETHYNRGQIYETIMAQLKQLGIDSHQVTRQDLAGADEFHVRGAQVSMELADQIGLHADTKVLDVGCGIGGPARMLADTYGCKVTGIDVTYEFIRTAQLLSQRLGLEERTEFIQADALELPFEDNRFDLVWTQHVQMNIADKQKFYSEIYRVLNPSGTLIYYDILGIGDTSTVHYPVPWAEDSSLSFLITMSELDDLLKQTGFTQRQTKDQTKEGLQFFNHLFDKLQKEGPPKVGLHFLMGESAGEKLKNVLRNLTEGHIILQSGQYSK